MINKYKKWQFLSLMFVFNLTLVSCSIFSGVNSDPVPTITPTNSGGMATLSNPCEGLSGALEMQILVGPSEAVGMEPFAIGKVLFSVVTNIEPYLIEGGGPINFDQQVFSAEWGTYTVAFDAESAITGICISTEDEEVLKLDVVMQGEQLIEVEVEGVQMSYPWSGTPELSVNFAIEEGSRQEGEGWLLILHIND